jgi:hypothetical protein
MNKTLYKNIVINIIITLIICLPVWWILKYFVPTDWSLILSLKANEEFFLAQRAFIGVILFSISSLISSLLFDLGKIQKPLVVKILRASLLIYFSIYWFNKIIYLLIIKTNIVLGINFTILIWPFLLLINLVAMSLVIMIEPWQIFWIAFHRVTNKFSTKKKILINSLFRFVVYVGFFGLFSWFSFALFSIEINEVWICTFVFISLALITLFFKVKNNKRLYN